MYVDVCDNAECRWSEYELVNENQLFYAYIKSAYLFFNFLF